MRVPEHHPRTRRHAVAALALAALLSATGAASPPPLAAFDRFELAAVVLADSLPPADANETARRQLQMHLADRVEPWIAERNRKPARGTPPRTLRIEPVVVAVDPVDPATRVAVGAMAGGGELRVHVRFVDVATGEPVAETDLHAGHPMLVNVATADAAGAQPRRIADGLVEFLDAAMTSAPMPEPRLPR
jgi:hypothetical protein